MLKDFRGLSVSGSNQDAVIHFETALTQLHSYTGDPIGSIDRAIEHDSGFVMGHIFKALALYTTSEQRYLPTAEEALDKAAALSATANQRERRLILATERLLAGDWLTASHVFDEILIDAPRDVLAIQVAHIMDFFRGDALNLRNRISRVLPAWEPSMPGYSYVLGMHAFGLEECNQYAEAEKQARRALEIEARDAWAIHAVAHVMEMQGRIDDGISWLTARQNDWANDNVLAPHNWWHLALFHLDQGDVARVLQIVDERLMTAQTDTILVLIDLSAMLWRLTLQGVEVQSRFELIADIWQSKLDLEKGFYAFNDFHAMLAFAATNRTTAIDALLRNMREAAQSGTPGNAEVTRTVGIPLAQAMLDFANGRYARAICRIEPVRDIANRFGGSHAQRDLLTLTLIEAAIRCHDLKRARHYVAERQVHKPTSWSHRLLSRANSDGSLAHAA